jgi:hypothetical protein
VSIVGCTGYGPIDIEDPITIPEFDQGVYGEIIYRVVDCMPGPGRTCTENNIHMEDTPIYFIDIETKDSYFTASIWEGYYKIELPVGEYIILPKSNSEYFFTLNHINHSCLLDITNCTEGEFNSINNTFISMERVCSSDDTWWLYSPCTVLIENFSLFRVDIKDMLLTQ